MTHLWERWEGVALPGDYKLQQYLTGDENAAFFEAARASGSSRITVKLVPAGDDDEAILGLWQRTRHLRHPNLVELLESGRAAHGDESVVYAVFEFPDDTLAAALPLGPAESREVLDATLHALRYLHAQGLVLSALDANRIVAVGNQIKLTTDTLREAETTSAYREDVRLLGEFWQQALLPASEKSAEIAAHAADPSPEARWTLSEINAALESVSPPAPPPQLPPPVLPAAPIATMDTAPAMPAAPPYVPERVDYRFPKWILAGAAVFLFLILALNWRHPSDATAQSPVVTSTSVPSAPPMPVPLPPAPKPKVEAPRPAAPAISKPSVPAGKEIWRVIAFTYRTRDAAARKAHQLNADHPGLNASVFEPEDKGGHYLVALGGRMTHDDAVRLQRSAHGKGLPRDLYVQNYSR